MKITKTQLKEIIKEEVSRLQKKTVLESRVKEINRELRILNEGFDSDKFTSGLEPQVAHSKDWNAPLNIVLPSVLRDIELEDWDGIKWYTNKGFEWDSEQNRYKVLFISHQAGPILMYYDPLTRDFHFPEREVISNWYDTLTKESKEGLSQIKDEIQKKVPEFKKELETSEVPLSEELEMSDIDDMSIEDKAVFSAMNDEEVEDDLSDVIAKYANQGGDYEGGYKDDVSVSPGYLSESNKKGKMKITKSQLKEIIKEEASRLKKQYILENKKKAITEELRMLNEDESIESILEKNPWISSIRGNVIDDADKEFNGNVDLRGSDITNIGHQLSRVKGDVYLTRLPISNTGVLSYVGGDLDLGGTNISRLEDLFALKYVGGFLNLSGTPLGNDLKSRNWRAGSPSENLKDLLSGGRDIQVKGEITV